ncbi:MAG: acyl--CoA ligase [Legionellales bacterium]|nr:acyl--CoA ligase [Legionellales bacterium]
MMNPNRLLDSHYSNKNPQFIISGEPIYRTQFLQDICALKKKLKDTPVQSYQLCFNHSYWFTVSLFAVLAANKEPVLLPNFQADTLLAFKKADTGVISDIENITSSFFVNTHSVCLTSSDEELDNLSLSLSQTITLYTSGTTGNPKKIQRTLREILSEIQVLESTFKAQLQSAIIYSSVSPQHLYGLIFYILWPLYAGRSIIYPQLNYPEQIAKMLQADEIKVLVSCPSLLSRLEFSVTKKHQHIIFSSGSLLKAEAAQSLHQNLHLQPIEVLGSTETGGIAFRQQMISARWQTFAKVNIDQDKNNLCLLVDSPFFSGEKPFLTADQVEIHPEGLFSLLGRVDRIVKVEGKRVSLDEIENHIKSHDFVSDAVVCFVDGQRQLLAALIVLNEEGEHILSSKNKYYLDREMKAWHSRLFDLVTRPKKIRYVSKIPVNSQGKTLLSDLKQILG